MSSAYHPESPLNEQTKWLINQSVILCNKPKGLGPSITSCLFQHAQHYKHLHWIFRKMGHSLRLLLPIFQTLPNGLAGTKEAIGTASIIEQIVQETKDSLTAAKITQAHYAKLHCSTKDVYIVGDQVVMLSIYWCQEYTTTGKL